MMEARELKNLVLSKNVQADSVKVQRSRTDGNKHNQAFTEAWKCSWESLQQLCGDKAYLDSKGEHSSQHKNKNLNFSYLVRTWPRLWVKEEPHERKRKGKKSIFPLIYNKYVQHDGNFVGMFTHTPVKTQKSEAKQGSIYQWWINDQNHLLGH